METAEKIGEKLSAKFEKFKNGSFKEEARMYFKEKAVEDKERERDKVRNYMKKWYIEQGQLISEINRLRKKDQSENLNKNQANLNEFKLKILFKHLKKEETLKKLDKNRTKLEKIRNNTLAMILNKKEKDNEEVQHVIADLHKSKNN